MGLSAYSQDKIIGLDSTHRAKRTLRYYTKHLMLNEPRRTLKAIEMPRVAQSH